MRSWLKKLFFKKVHPLSVIFTYHNAIKGHHMLLNTTSNECVEQKNDLRLCLGSLSCSMTQSWPTCSWQLACGVWAHTLCLFFSTHGAVHYGVFRCSFANLSLENLNRLSPGKEPNKPYLFSFSLMVLSWKLAFSMLTEAFRCDM